MGKIIILVIKGYRFFISPFFPASCRFTPTCSAYSIEAIDRYGFFKGTYLTLRRIFSCHPFHAGGYDPVK